MDDHQKVATTTGGAVGISVFASFIGLCCIGPWAVVLFGVSGAVTMARLPAATRLRRWLLRDRTVHLAEGHALGRRGHGCPGIFCR